MWLKRALTREDLEKKPNYEQNGMGEKIPMCRMEYPENYPCVGQMRGKLSIF